MKHILLSTCMIVWLSVTTFETQATPYAKHGWSTQLATYHHDVAGTVTIIDADTYRIDDFVYDGQGPAVYLYLAASTNTADLEAGLSSMYLPAGTAYDGSAPLVVDLPGGETFDDYNAISVWCVAFSVDFGSGTFTAPDPNCIPSDYNCDGVVGLLDLDILGRFWGDTNVTFAQGDDNGDGIVGLLDLDALGKNWGNTAPTPEPSTLGLVTLGALMLCRRGA